MGRTVNPIQDRAKRAALEKAAYLAIYERGYAGVTLADIAVHAGVSRGMLVYHFGSRAGLLAAVMKRFTRTIGVATRRALRLAKTPEQKLQAFVENQFYGVQNTRRFYTVSLDFLAAATRDPELMAVSAGLSARNPSPRFRIGSSLWVSRSRSTSQTVARPSRRLKHALFSRPPTRFGNLQKRLFGWA